MIPAAIIEKAARAKFYRAHPEYPADENHWENVSESYRRMFRDSVARTLTPVYADIQAEALREVHAAIQGELDSDSLMASLLRLDCNQTARDAVGWVQEVLQCPRSITTRTGDQSCPCVRHVTEGDPK